MKSGDPDLDSLARMYVADRKARVQAEADEKKSKAAVLSAMSQKKMTAYRYDSGEWLEQMDSMNFACVRSYEIFELSVKV